MATRAIIICAGEATRWQNYLGVPKHLIEIEGEKILFRTTRLLKKHGVKEIFVVVKEHDNRYVTPESKLHVIEPNYRKNADADKFLSSKDLWNRKGRTLVIYGDVYFTEDAIKKIMKFKEKEWTLFCRPNASKITGTPWGECFAQSFYPQHIRLHKENLNFIAYKKRAGQIKRCGGWEHYRAMTDQRDLNTHTMTTNYVEIDDWTDDFDYPKDYETWLENRNKLQ